MIDAPSSVYFDTNAFIAAFETEGDTSDRIWEMLQAVDSGEVVGVTSELTLAELLVKPLEKQARDLVEAYEEIISPSGTFQVVPVDRAILISAARLRAEKPSAKLPDAIHIASAMQLPCKFFISGDRRLALPEGMQQLGVRTFRIDDILLPRP